MEPKKTSQNKNNWNIFFFWGFLALELYWVPSSLCEFTTLKLLQVIVYACVIIKSGIEIIKSKPQ